MTNSNCVRNLVDSPLHDEVSARCHNDCHSDRNGSRRPSTNRERARNFSQLPGCRSTDHHFTCVLNELFNFRFARGYLKYSDPAVEYSHPHSDEGGSLTRSANGSRDPTVMLRRNTHSIIHVCEGTTQLCQYSLA